MLLPSRKASIGSTYNSNEDIATHASSEAGERQSMGMLASPLFTQKREASATPSRIYQPKLRRCTRPKEGRAEIQKSLQESFSERERIFSGNREGQDFLELRADKAAQREQAAPTQTL